MFTKDRKISYYASQLSENISETPEGYLVCKEVPIARIGVQEYLGREIGVMDNPDDFVKVYREAEDVFAPEAIASFEGKPFTNNHPEPKVDINNLPMYGKGHVQNVRRSSSEPDLLVADIIVTDPNTISEIKNKLKREISSGYDCFYVPYKDGYRQVEIRGNHIALVSKGRAGSRVSIKDNLIERKNKMAKTHIFAAMLKAFARDANPEEVAEAVDALNQRDAEEEKAKVMEALKSKVEEKPTEDDEGDPMAKVMGRLDSLEERLNKLFASQESESNDEDPEEEATEEKVELTEGKEEEVEDSDEEVEEEEKLVVSKDTLDNLRMAVARIRNPQDRTKTSDALMKVYGRSKSTSDVYSAVNKVAQTHKVQDSEPSNLEDLGKKIAAKWNPHYKQGE